MPSIRFESLDSINETFISPYEIPEGVWADFSRVLLTYGGQPQRHGFSLSRLSLRRAAHDIGQLLDHYDLQAEYDNPVKRLLDLHVREVRARKDAERDSSSLTPIQVNSQVQATGRFRRALTDNQLRDLGRLLKLPHGANFSVPGAGKTATLLALYEAGRAQGLLDRLLVVAPKNAFLSWEEEVALCYGKGNKPTIERIVGGRQKAAGALAHDSEVALITYQFLPNILEPIAEWCRRHKTHLVLDESHRIKAGRGGVFATAALELSDAAARRDILSGTPLPHAPEGLRSQVEFLWPGQRILPDQRVGAESSSDLVGQVQRSVHSLYVRTTKAELKLPPLRLVPVRVKLGPLQRELYELLRSEAKRLAAGMSLEDRRLLRSLGAHVMRLLEAATNPMLLAQTELLDAEIGSVSVRSRAWELLKEVARCERPAKIQKVLDIAEDCLKRDQAHKILIWTSFVKNVQVLERLLEHFSPVTLYGAIPIGSEEDSDTREGRIRQFHYDPNCRVMIANPAACGEGISLHQACHHAVYLDRTFNAAHYLQSIDRIHRLGLPATTVTRVEILEARSTIDSRVARRLKAKIDSMSLILNDPGLAALAYDPEDVVEEFPAGIELEDVEEIIDHLTREENDES
jgi:SNF2 family DNA or RNA helicase